MSLVKTSPATFILSWTTIPPREMTAISVVPPPMSTTIFPLGASTSSPIPRADAIGSKIKYTSLPPACSDESRTALISTSVLPDGIPTTIFMFGVKIDFLLLLTCLMNPLIIISAALKSAITPSFIGRTVLMPGFSLSCINLAFCPRAIAFPVALSIATMLGSSRTIWSFIKMTVFAVPRSIAISCVKNENPILFPNFK